MKKILIFVAMMTITSLAYGEMLQPPYVQLTGGLYQGYDYEHITVGFTPIGFTASKYNPTEGRCAKRVFVTAATTTMRFRYDGTDPDGDTGHTLNVGDTLAVIGKTNIENFRALPTSATTSGLLRVTYER